MLDSRKALVAWHNFFNPKASSGCNLINMAKWNKAAMLKLHWAITFKADKLWFQWIVAYYMRRHDVYSVVITNNFGF